MSIVTIRRCDVCGEVVDKNEHQFWTVGVYASCTDHMSSPAMAKYEAPFKSINVCRKCLENMGIVPKVVTKAAPSDEPSIEDLVRDIVRLVREDD